MSYEPSDALYLDHIHERIQRIEECAHEGRDAFEASHMLQDAIMRNFEVIGEAAFGLRARDADRGRRGWRSLPPGRSKAAFFEQFDFRATDWR